MQKIAVTVPEAVAMTGIGRTILYRYFNSGELKPRKSGKRTLILVSELEHLVKSLPRWQPDKSYRRGYPQHRVITPTKDQSQ